MRDDRPPALPYAAHRTALARLAERAARPTVAVEPPLEPPLVRTSVLALIPQQQARALMARRHS
jgi:hypothetical protein